MRNCSLWPKSLTNRCLGWCLESAKIVEICQKGDKLLDEEISKVYKGKKINKGAFFCHWTSSLDVPIN